MMKMIQAKDYADLSAKAANLLFARIVTKPDSVLGLATGSSVLGIYGKLIESYQKGDLDFSRVKTFNLDEYVGLAEDDAQSYRYYMNENFFKHINIKRENARLPDGAAADVAAECARYNAMIEESGGADIQLLGIGLNGHIGFNEPKDHFVKETHVVALDESTIQANARFFADAGQVPRRAITMGVQNIMLAKKIILCVSGKQKAAILKEALRGPVTPKVPASILQFHRNLTVVADADALGAARE